MASSCLSLRLSAILSMMFEPVFSASVKYVDATNLETAHTLCQRLQESIKKVLHESLNENILGILTEEIFVRMEFSHHDHVTL